MKFEKRDIESSEVPHTLIMAVFYFIIIIIILFFFVLFFLDGSDNNSAVFGLVEKSVLQRAKLSRRGSLGISGGEEGMVSFP